MILLDSRPLDVNECTKDVVPITMDVLLLVPIPHVLLLVVLLELLLGAVLLLALVTLESNLERI